MKRLILFSLCVLFVSSITFADWDPGDDYKMHFPQLPDPEGWDVFAGLNPHVGYPKVVADDWQCIQDGPVDDIHLWGSWKDDMQSQIQLIHVSIHDNIPAGELAPWSMPGDLLWDWEFYPVNL